MPLVAGVVAGPLLVTVTLIGGATRRGYSVLRHDVSSLALGELGWIHSLAFVITGLLTLAFAVGGLRPAFESDTACGPWLVSGWAVGLVVIGLFVTDPTTGYPSEIPAEAVVRTVGGAVHDVAAAVTFIALTAALVVFTRVFARHGRRVWAGYTALSAFVVVFASIVASYGSQRTGGMGELDGLFQRIAGASGLAWLTVVAVALLLRSASWR